MEFSTRIINGHYLVSCSSNGAVSLFSPAEYLAFKAVIDAPEEEHTDILRDLLTGKGCSEDQINGFTGIFLRKLKQQGWFRIGFGYTEPEKLRIVYLSITSSCNLACIYCYIGDERRQPDYVMEYEDAADIIDKIKEFNPAARIVVTGGEPLMHPDFFNILDKLDQSGLNFTLGTNAILIDDSKAERLSRYKNLIYVQVSLDGMTPEVHGLTRGNSWHAVMKGLSFIIRHKVPFAVAPTLHEGNLHEVDAIAHFTCSNGGFLAPNHLRQFPQAPNAREISLSTQSLRTSIIETFGKINNEFGHHEMPAGLADPKFFNLSVNRCRHVCGNGWHTVDIDWNGDVYPCHLLREKTFILGNILREGFDVIFERGGQSLSRIKAYETPKCRNCPFVATCGGGCRASAWFTHGTFEAEDVFCEILYKFEVDKLFQTKGIDYNS